MSEMNMNIAPDPAAKPVIKPAAEETASAATTPAVTVPAEEVTLVDGLPSGKPNGETKTDNKAASAEEAPPAVASANPQDARIWDETFPGFAGQSGSMPADMQAQMWRNKALTGTTATSPKEDEGPGRPPVVPLPLLDPDAAAKRLEEAITDGNTEAQIAATAEIAAFARGAAETVNSYGMQNEFDIRQMQTKIDQLQLPATIRQVGVGMPGFQDSDVAAALTLLESGQCSDPALAVGYAVNARLVESKSTPPPSLTDETRRKAEALAAASAPESETTSPVPKFAGSPRMDSPEMKAALLADHLAEQAAKAK